MSLRLRIEHGQDAGKTWRLPVAGVYTLGRSPQNSIRVLDMKVSKTHCELRVAEHNGSLHAALHDPESTHGCELNGQPVARGKDVRIKPGDELRLGLTILRLLSAGDSDDDAKPVAGRSVDGAPAAPASNGDGATRQTLPPDALVGKQLGGYMVEKKIGMGGMGGVYLAEQVSLNRKVALKVLNETFASDSAFVDQFVNEARAAGALNHPNVVQVYDVGDDQGHYYFSMEVMPGGSLEDKIREAPVDWEVGLNWFLDATNALIFAKRREILHRDVKPDNLMIGEDESAKLCDLGLAKKSEVADLMDQGIIGTPHFISPEAIRRKGDIDHRTDLYSLGCTFYRVFTGKNPYPAGTVKEIILGHLNKPIPHATALNPEVPKEIDAAIAMLMAKDPAERYQTPEELLRELDKIRTKYNLEAHGIKPASRKPLVIGAAAAAIAIGVAIFFAMQGPGEPSERERTPQEIEMAAQAEREVKKGKLNTVVNAAATTYNARFKRFLDGQIDDDDNWEKQLFKDLSREAKTDAETWETQVKTWVKAKGAIKDPKLVSIYETAIKALDAHAVNMRKIHTDIAATIKERTQFKAQIKEGKAKTLADAEAAISKYARDLKALYDTQAYPDWIALEAWIKGTPPDATSKTLASIVEALLARKVGRFPLIDQKTIDKILKKHAPITKKDAPRGIQWVDQAVRTIKGRKDDILNKVQKLLAGTPSHKEYAAARTACQTFLDSLPADLQGPLAAAPQVVSELKRAREAVERLLDGANKAYESYIVAEYASDRSFYFRLALKIWNPEHGHLQRFNFEEARREIEQTQVLVRVKGYRDLVASWLPLVDSLEALFKHIVEGEKNGGWTEPYFTYVDKRGKTKRVKIRDITDQGVKWEKAIVPFHQSSPRFLLENLFFFEDKARLKSCAIGDHAGLGLLAELAGRYDVATAQYMEAKSKAKPEVDDALLAAITTRLTRLGQERQAAERFFAIVEFGNRLSDWMDPFEEQVRSMAGDPDAFTDREKALAESVQYRKDMAAMFQMVDDLTNKSEFAATMWASSLRETLHPRAAYIGEAIPDSVKEPERAPRKGPPKKNGTGKKDAPRKKAEPRDEPGEPGKGAPPKDGPPPKGAPPPRNGPAPKGGGGKNGGGGRGR